MSMVMLVEFLGWMLVINIAMLMLSVLMICALKNRITKIHQFLFDIPAEELRKVYLQFLGHYKLMIVVFNLVPYLALKLMG